MTVMPSSVQVAQHGEHLSIVDVRKSYGPFVAVAGISLDIPAGTLLTLLGPSGCGKSTLLRMIAGFVNTDQGQILIGGRDIVAVAPYQRETAMVFQSYALFPHMTITENVMFGLKMRKVPADQARKRALEALDMVRLTHLAERYPSQLSGGQQQRAALARALVTEPRVLLLDEPFGALDKNLRDEMQIELRKLQQLVGVTTVCVTHDQHEAMMISDLIAVMHEGRIEQCGTPAQIYDEPQTRFVANFIGTSNTLSGFGTDTRDEFTAVRLSGGSELTIPAHYGVKPAEAVDVLVRPGAVRLRAQSTEPHTSSAGISRLDGKVGFSTNLGDKVSYEVELLNGARLLVDAQRHAGEQTFAIGQPVDILIAAQDCRVLRGQ